MLRSLYARLAAALLGLFVLVAILYLGIVLFSTRLYLQEANQRLHRDLARGLVSEGLIGEGGEVGQEALESVFHTLMVVNPSIEVYLLDDEGRILSYSAPPGRVRAKRVSLKPIRRFLEDPDRIPVLGDDPRHPGERRVFSAAPIEKGGRVRGYLYVILAGEPYESAFHLLRQSYIARLSLGLAALGLGFVLVAGLLFFHLLTRRVRRLTESVEAFPAVAPEAEEAGRGDEIRRLERAFGEMAERIQDQVARLRGIDSERRTLLTHISHDLRTPLASLQGNLETLLLKGPDLDREERRRSLEVALESSRRLGSLVGDLFELAKLDAPETPVDAEPFPLPELAHDVAQKLRVGAEARGVGIEVRAAPGLPFVRADLGLVERALENLLQNAVRHSPAGETVEVRFATSDAYVDVRVMDRGAGVAPEDLPHLFDRFYRRAEGNAGGGAGLGLAIVKRIAELHGGTVGASNREGGGAIFTLALPVHGRGTSGKQPAG